MGNTTLQQKEHQDVPDRPGKGAGDEAHMQYRLAVLAICSEMHEAGRTYADIAARFCLCEDTLREWRKRYEENGKEGLRPRDRKLVRYNGGQLPVISAIDVRTRFLWFHHVHQLCSEPPQRELN